MDNGERKLSSLFDGRTILNIPDYQRSYSWGILQLSDFLEDIQNQKLGRSYFYGTVLFQEKGLDENYEIIDIVDGQQRLTTVIIFMAVVIEKLSELISNDVEQEELDLLRETYIKHRRRYKLQMQSEDNDFFHSYILENSSGKDYARTPAQTRLIYAKDYFSRHLSGYGKEELEEIKKKVDENLRVLVYSVKDTAEATLIFETTNDRGKNLTDLEKIKSFVMYKSYMASENPPEELLSKIRNRFSEIYREYESFSQEMSEDSILQYHFICSENWSGKEYQRNVQALKKHINKMVGNNKDTQVLEYIDKYTRELKETFSTVKILLKSKIRPVRDIFLLNRISNFWPLLIKSYKLDTSENKEQFHSVARLLEIYSFRIYAINQNRGNTGQSKLYGLAKDFEGNYKSLCESLSLLIEEYSDDKSFKNNLSRIDLYHKVGSKDLGYLFWKYENYLRSDFQPKAPPMSEDEISDKSSNLKMSIEHVASQTPAKSVVNDVDILPKIDEDFEEQYLHSIGNLTIDPLSANASKGNKAFTEKNDGYFVRAPFKTQNELEDYLIDKKWTSESITTRKNKLIDFALNNWKTRY